MRSLAYYIGLVAADFLIFTILCIFFLIALAILNLSIMRGAGVIISFFFALVIFGLALINCLNLLGFTFSNVHTTFKVASCYLFLLAFAVPLIPIVVAGPLHLSADALKVLNVLIRIISPFACLFSGMRMILINAFLDSEQAANHISEAEKERARQDVTRATQDPPLYASMLTMLAQAAVYFALCVWLDARRCNAFRGEDHKPESAHRPLLPENQDVIDHRNELEEAWLSQDE